MHSAENLHLPTESLLLVAIYLPPEDQYSFLQAVPGIARLFSPDHLASTNYRGDTILHLLARERGSQNPCFLEMVSSNHGASLHPQNRDGITPLMEATLKGNLPFMRALIEKDPDGLNIVDERDETALHYAVNPGYPDGITLLLAQPSIKGSLEDLLVYALDVEVQAYKAADFLINHPDIDLAAAVDDERGDTVLMLAARLVFQDAADVARSILARGGVDINAVNHYGESAAHIAAMYGQYWVLELLLAQDGIDVDRRDSAGRTPLSFAQYGCVQVLLDHGGVEVDSVDRSGRSPLSYTAERGDEDEARLLLAHGARPDLQDASGHTPIWWAARARRTEMVKLLEAAANGCCYEGA